ncbi:3 beta-hydroxysteroid dehydrogenase/Delta 5--_4-isomerase [Rosistilla carotiformis]|uniref:3 beta-hydroxysteroid dehydrogenase/Delta 5-->4-isomerase n=1 Tax=Rosistilla carotiformis TaxID=2528017 RepID=A0A518JX22_9BACT|nr:NAD(P)-dependent oxidoreductase [Rosistilla carotiformis]QDV70084.1 3 beta-hydroxysteroid dehydrogenase/Delta 5-->4-isomerase [Rosistilla carotiformis]
MSTQRPAVIVTGSSGLLGQPVCEALAHRGYEVFGFDRVGLPEPPKANPHVHDIECDITSYSNVRAAIEDVRRRTDGKLASVVHMAAYYDFSGEDSDAYEAITIHGTDRLLNALDGFELQQFIFTSTMLVHAPCEPGQRITEEDPLLAKWPYPKSKIETERLIREGHPSVRSVFLRVAGVYTDYGRQPTLVQQIKRIDEKDFQSYFFPGDTDAGQSVVHLDDVVDAIIATVENRAKIEAKTAILIGEPDPPSYEALQDAIGQRIHGEDWTTLYVPKTVAKVGAAVTDKLSGGDAFIKPFMVDMADDHYALDISRAKALLGWQPKHRLIDHLPKILDALEKNRSQWLRLNGLES